MLSAEAAADEADAGALEAEPAAPEADGGVDADGAHAPATHVATSNANPRMHTRRMTITTSGDGGLVRDVERGARQPHGAD